MTTPGHHSTEPPPRWSAVAEWILVLGVAIVLAGTMLALGGVLARTMIWVSWSVTGLALLGGVLWVLGYGAGTRTLHWAALLPVPFLLYALVSVVWWAPAGWLAWREWLIWLQTWLVFVVALHFGRRPAHARIWLGTIIGLAVVGAGLAIYQRYGDASWMMLGRKQADQFVGRSAGMFGVPNSLAGLLECVIPLCVGVLFARGRRRGLTLAAGLLAVLLLFALVLTGSRGGWISLALALLVWPLLVGRRMQIKLLGTAGVLLTVAVAIGGLYVGSGYARERIQPFIEGKFESSRPIIWKAGLQMWQDSPWEGRGAAAFNVLFEQYRPRGFLNEPNWTHNDYLNILCDYGLAGFALWAGAGFALGALGWVAWQRARRDGAPGDESPVARKVWKLGLLLGLLAFALHLAVDFHTRIPGLAFLAAILVALLVRDEPAWHRSIGAVPAVVGGAAFAAALLALIWRVAVPLYGAEALREEARRTIDRFAITGEGEMGVIAPAAKKALSKAVRLDPGNGQAWADLAYATVQSWEKEGSDLVALGRFAELAADEALARCPIIAEFWLRKGVALQVQRGRPGAEDCFRRALELAPHSPQVWYHHAYYLQAFPSKREEFHRALGTCLALDPHYPAANTLRQQLATTP
ncbi:MAG: hypothetical protein RL091_2169 [Verrucomicrobiota bacterium]